MGKVRFAVETLGAAAATYSAGAIATNILLHDVYAHGSLDITPNTERVLRGALWFSTPAQPRGWVGVHRNHHKYVDTPFDPHSPKYNGGAFLTMLKTPILYMKYLREHPAEVAAEADKRNVKAFRYPNSIVRFAAMTAVNKSLTGHWGSALAGTTLGHVARLVASGIPNGYGHDGPDMGKPQGKARDLGPVADALLFGAGHHGGHHADALDAYSRSPEEQARLGDKPLASDFSGHIIHQLVKHGMASIPE